jgi:6-pyruvoyltetrahydropterin/6-carboxytetrahydropterin synthase
VVRVTRSIHFSTSLRYRLPSLSEEENRARFGRAAGQHGHNYRLEITLRGEPDPETGMVFNLTELKQIAGREIMSRFDHKDLNADTVFFEKVLPTPENFALVIFRLLDAAVPNGLLERIRLHESPEIYVDVVGPT